MLEFYITKRVLAESKKGPCKVTNHVDSCWRCDPDWEKNRKKLADCALGFAQGTTGRKDGEFYVVADPIDNAADPKPGTLRHAVTQTGPLWITFKGDKTIDARGANVEICNGAGITIQFAKNIIIHGLQIHHIIPTKGGKIKNGENHHGLRGDSDGDWVSLFGATNIWLDHLSLHHCVDGLIDVVQGSTAVTVSNYHFTDHNDCRQEDAGHCCFEHFGKGLVERMPRCRFGFIHVVNNDYNHWFLYAIGETSNPTIISQGNRYSAPGFGAKEVTYRGLLKPGQWKNWNWVSEGDHFENGAFFTPSGNPSASKQFGGDKMMPFKPGQMVPELTKYARPLSCTIGCPC
uniref:Pectate lyase n=1 Tax=Gossypium raimondii TaxID=29730 RepID=A0A0D2TZA8_GOSRA|nr:hypothetical protein B456_009G334600 [Gossypium raimondii]